MSISIPVKNVLLNKYVFEKILNRCVTIRIEIEALIMVLLTISRIGVPNMTLNWKFRFMQAFFLSWLLCVSQLQGAVLRSADLGWSAGQDISKQFVELLNNGTIKAGDELRLEHT